MNKTVLINIAGKVFHIEEDAYKLIMDYDQSIRTYFMDQEGGSEIISDIENRIAELLNERLILNRSTVVQLDDVKYIITRLGKVADFQYDGEKVNSNPNSSWTEGIDFKRKLYRNPDNKMLGGVCSGLSTYFSLDVTLIRLLLVLFFAATFVPYVVMWIVIPKAKSMDDLQPEKTIIRRLYRDPDHKILGGVCSGIAAYFNIDPTWIRLIFIILTIPVTVIFWHGGFSFPIIFFYFILWAIMPLARTRIEKQAMKGDLEDEDFENFTPSFHSFDAKRKLFRDTEHKVLGGVCSGIASFFDLDVILVRLVFIFLTIFPIIPNVSFHYFNGFMYWTIPFIYILLWIIIPEAKTVADKVAMRGDADNLDGIVKNVERNKYEDEGMLNNIIRFVVNIFRLSLKLIVVIAGVLLILISILSMFTLVLSSIFYVKDMGFPFENYQIFSGFNKTLLLISGLVFLGVPALALLWLGLRLSVNIKSINKKINFSLLGIWILSFALILYLSVVGALSFRERAKMEESIKLKTYTNYQVQLIDENITYEELGNGITRIFKLDILEKNRVRFFWEKSTDQHARIIKESRAYGKDGENAIQNAGNIRYEIVLQDSLISFPSAFSFPTNDLWRDQHLDVRVYLPVGSNIIMNRNDSWRFGLYDKQTGDAKQVVWTMTEEGIMQEHPSEIKSEDK